MFDIVVFMRYKNSNVYLDGCLYFLVKDQQILTKVLSELLFLELHLYIYLFLYCYIFAFMVFNIHYLTNLWLCCADTRTRFWDPPWGSAWIIVNGICLFTSLPFKKLSLWLNGLFMPSFQCSTNEILGTSSSETFNLVIKIFFYILMWCVLGFGIYGFMGDSKIKRM